MSRISSTATFIVAVAVVCDNSYSFFSSGNSDVRVIMDAIFFLYFSLQNPYKS